MRQLYLLRHSKAGQTDRFLVEDHERPLTEKGVGLCEIIGEHMTKTKQIPQLVLSSTARRAKETANEVIKYINKEISIKLISNLYLASPEDILKTINELGDDVSSVMIVGHNPGFQQFCVQFSYDGNKKKYREMKGSFPPPSLAVFSVAKKWNEVTAKSGKLIDFVAAKNLKKEQSNVASLSR